MLVVATAFADNWAFPIAPFVTVAATAANCAYGDGKTCTRGQSVWVVGPLVMVMSSQRALPLNAPAPKSRFTEKSPLKSVGLFVMVALIWFPLRSEEHTSELQS